MSPSEGKPGAPPSGNSNIGSSVWLASKDLPLGVPDPAVLARMANEFFTALPEFAQLSNVVLAAPEQLPSVPAGAEPRVAPQGVAGLAPPTAFPTEAELRALPSTLAGFSAPSLPELGEIPSSLPTIPGDFAAIRFSAIPSLSFLEEARPIFADAVASLTSPARSAATVQNSSEGELQAATATVPDAGDLSGTKSVATPLVPDAW